jgi:hypothetical protein
MKVSKTILAAVALASAVGWSLAGVTIIHADDQPSGKHDRVVEHRDLEQDYQTLQALRAKLRDDQSHRANPKTIRKDEIAIEKLENRIHFSG